MFCRSRWRTVCEIGFGTVLLQSHLLGLQLVRIQHGQVVQHRQPPPVLPGSLRVMPVRHVEHGGQQGT